MDRLDIVVDGESNRISVRNNGAGIPVEMHKKEKCYVPTLIFGHLLTGSNFDDNEKKTTGGRNGYGAKLANIFSTEFIVECLDSEMGVKFKQIFRNNMGVAEEPVIKKATKAEIKKGDYTMITFSPDLEKFNMTAGGLDKDTVSLLSKRAYDIAGSMAARAGKRLQVSLNGKTLPIKNFSDYLKLLNGVNPPVAYEKVNDRWEIGVASSPQEVFDQISFVNAICTSKGGTHVNYIADQIGSHLQKTIKKKNKEGTEVKPAQIKNHLCVFVNCLVENPSFDSQTKENLTNQKKNFGSQAKLSDAFLKKVDKSDIVEQILSYAKFKARKELGRKGGVKKAKLTGIPKLEDANHAGTAKSKDCTLILTEGDSAKSLAMSGLSVVGRDFYGVFPLKGKPLNVRDASHGAVMKNAEMKYIMDIMGLKPNTVYDEKNIKTLRYGHLMIMADQDHDGSHIKGLIINMIHNFWPGLLDVPGFLQQFITPIVKITKGKKSQTFFTLPEYEAWKASTGNEGKGWKIKYYKGLGTSTSAEAKEYFSNLDMHEVHFEELSKDKCMPFINSQDEDDDMEFDNANPDEVVSGSDLIDMAFRKNRVEDRKRWLNGFNQETFMDYSAAKESGVKYSDFINKEFILFSKSDCARSIPHIMDGFKPSQRKVLYSCFKRKLKDEIKVAQLAGYIGEHSAYHHGEASLHTTIIGMAQSFVGSNNVNLLTPSGQFGTRRMGGKDSASPRYIFTKLEKITRAIFHPDDDALLTYLHDDGVVVEPEHYMPVIPMVLVNGSDGIGTGWSSTVNNYDPRQIIDNLRHMIHGEDIEEMDPYYSGFVGSVTREGNGKFSVRGVLERVNDTTILITELPVRKWTQDYKGFLEEMLVASKGSDSPDIKDFKENHTDTSISFTITAEKAKIDAWEKEKGGLYQKFKLNSSISTSNMNLFDTEGRIIKYASPEEILSTFYSLRLEYYDRRKTLLVKNLQKEQSMLSNKARFVEEVCSGDLVVSNRKKTELLADLQERGYDLFDKQDEPSDESEEEEHDYSDSQLSKGYEYLLGMKIWSLTYEKAEELRSQLAEKTEELATLEATSPSQIWLNDLDAVEDALDERDAEIEASERAEAKAQKKNKKVQANKNKKAAKKGKKKKDEWDSDLEDSDEDDGFMEDSDSDMEVVVTKKPAARRRPAAVRKPAPKPVTENRAPAPAAKKAAKKTVAPPPSPPKEPEVDAIELSLADRIKKNLMVSPDGKKNASKAGLKMDMDFDVPPSISLSDGEEENDSPKSSSSVSTGRGKKRSSPTNAGNVAKKVASKKSPKKKAPAKKPAAKKVAPKKKKVYDSDDFEDSEDDMSFNGGDSDDDSVPAVAAPRARSARTTARKPISYDFSDESDEGEDSDF